MEEGCSAFSQPLTRGRQSISDSQTEPVRNLLSNNGGLEIKRPSTAWWEFAECILFDCYKTGYVTVTVIFQFYVIIQAFYIFFFLFELCNEKKIYKKIKGTRNMSVCEIFILWPFKEMKYVCEHDRLLSVIKQANR